MSIVESLLDTAKSSIKPHFTAHKTLVKVGQDSLPITVELIPYGVSFASVTLCGTPDSPNIMPLIPTQFSVWAGMTWGDILGGLLGEDTRELKPLLLSAIVDKDRDLLSMVWAASTFT